jgi:hypothetical protein
MAQKTVNFNIIKVSSLLLETSRMAHADVFDVHGSYNQARWGRHEWSAGSTVEQQACQQLQHAPP